MPTTATEQIETVREKLKNGERGGTDTDRDTILQFSDRLKLLAEEYSDDRHIKLLRHLMRISENATHNGNGILTDALTNRDAAETAVRWIQDNYDNPETNRDYRVSLRVLGRRVGDCETTDCNDDDIPYSIAWISSKTPRNYDPSPNPAELLTWDDHDAMIDAARNTRDAAMVALLMDAGPRGGEFYNIKREDLTDSEFGLQLWVDGKTGQRSVTLIPSVSYVNQWLAKHPGEDDSDYLWTRLTTNDRLSRQRIYQILRTLADRADITNKKKTTPTAFRKANATWLARTGANGPLIARRQGRKIGSKAVARYIAEFGEQSEQSAYAQLHGRDVTTGDEPEKRDSISCPRCDKENPATEDLCVWCGQGLDPTGVDKAEQTEKRVRTALAHLDPDAAEKFIEAIDVMDDNPALRAAFRTNAAND